MYAVLWEFIIKNHNVEHDMWIESDSIRKEVGNSEDGSLLESGGS